MNKETKKKKNGKIYEMKIEFDGYVCSALQTKSKYIHQNMRLISSYVYLSAFLNEYL